MARRTLIDFFDDLASHDRRVPRLRRRLSHLVADATREVAAAARALRRPAPRRRHRQGPDGRRSGARTAPSGSSRSGAACSKASCSSRSTIARRPPFSARVADIVDARAHPRRRRRRRAALERRARAGVAARRAADQPAASSSRRRRAADAHRRRHRRDHLHVGRDRRAEGRRHHASQHPREHRADRARGGEVPAATRGRSCRSGS